MRFSLSLPARSVILTTFLVVSQLVFIIVLTQVLQTSQQRLEKQWKSENLLRVTFSICRAFSQLVVYVHMPPVMRDVASSDPVVELARSRRETVLLQKLAADDPRKNAALSKFMASYAGLTRLMETVLKHNDETGGFPANFGVPPHFRSRLNKYANDFYDAGEQIVALEKQQHDAEHISQTAFSAFSNTLISAVFACVLLAVVLGYAYAISISRPLKHLSDNARLLSAQKPLLPQLTQQDEFGKLDAILQATSCEIERTLEQERETIDNAADLICTLDDNGRFLDVNSFAQQMLGMPASQFISTSISAVTVAEQSLLAEEYVRKVIKSCTMEQFELRLLHVQGQTIDTLWSCLWSPAEKKLFCVVRDVSEEKKIEQLKQDFADMISHDLRSPLMAMGNALTLVMAGAKGDLPDAARQRIEMSARNVDKLIVLVNDLLDFQKLKAGKMELALERVPLESIINDAADLVEEAARDKGVKLELPAGETVLQCDRIKLLQAAVNLIANAIKFSSPGGAVSIRVDRGVETVSFSVSDTGPGIDPEFVDRIFEPFEQAPSEKKKEGTGLGLAICKLVVEAHGGNIRVDNRADLEAGTHGCVFTVELPA
ncbi:MAG: PAS domain-containing sensor histidine kinase [Candidatus Melainabacteria bacterium]|nr:PAS domain-containing sensor histidine kinase [Candidatus Melainabacteria bacterium]